MALASLAPVPVKLVLVLLLLLLPPPPLLLRMLLLQLLLHLSSLKEKALEIKVTAQGPGARVAARSVEDRPCARP